MNYDVKEPQVADWKNEIVCVDNVGKQCEKGSGLVSAEFDKGTNTLTLVTGDKTEYKIDLSSLATDIKLQSGTYDSSTKKLDLKLSDGTDILVDVADLLAVAIDKGLDGDGTTNNKLTVKISSDAGNIAKFGADDGILATVETDKGIEGAGIAGDELSVKISEDDNNIVTFGSDDGLFIDSEKIGTIKSFTYDRVAKILKIEEKDGTIHEIETVDFAKYISKIEYNDADKTLEFTKYDGVLSSIDKVDISALADDTYIVSGSFNDALNELELKNNKGDVVTIDLSKLKDDIHVVSATLKYGASIWELNMSDGSKVELDVAPFLKVFADGESIEGDGRDGDKLRIKKDSTDLNYMLISDKGVRIGAPDGRERPSDKNVYLTIGWDGKNEWRSVPVNMSPRNPDGQDDYFQNGTRWVNKSTGKQFVKVDDVWIHNTPEDTGWIDAEYKNGWKNYGGGYPGAKYRVINSVLYIRGLVKGGDNNTVIFTLPKEIKDRLGGTPINICLSDKNTVARVDIGKGSGDVKLIGGYKKWVSLEITAALLW